MKKICFFLGVLLLFSVSANLVSLVVLDRALFYRDHINALERSFVNEGVRLRDNDKISRLPDSGVKVASFLGGNLVRFWFLPTDLPLVLVNRGRVEEKISVTLSRFPKTVLAAKADYAIINAGFCEIFTSINAGRDPKPLVKKDFQVLQEIVALAREYGVKPILTTLPPVRPRVMLPHMHLLEYHEKNIALENKSFAEYNDLIRELSRQKRLPLIDFYALLVDSEGQLDRKYAGLDGEHLNDAGYMVLSRALRQQLPKIIEDL